MTGDVERRPVKHDHLGQERIDMVDPWVKRIVCWCGYEADLPADSDPSQPSTA